MGNDNTELIKKLEMAQDQIHSLERNLILIERKLLNLINYDLVNKSILKDVVDLISQTIDYRVLINKVWRDLLLEYKIRQANLIQKGEQL